MSRDGPVRAPCPVLELARVGGYWELLVAAPRIAGPARPGQFVEVAAGQGHAFGLRRPFSIHRVAPGGALALVFDVVGPVTAALAAARPGEAADVIGPLGRPFAPPRPGTSCLLVGGGYGLAPLFFLAEELRGHGCPVHFLAGASTAARLLKPVEAARAGASLTVTTDDGSAGRLGTVTDAMPEVMARTGTGAVYACGPMPMLAAVSRVAAAARVPSQVAVEEHMACGTGICFSCVVPVRSGRDGTGPSRMARSCTEGPVFAGDGVAWAELGHAPADPVAEELLP